MLTYFWQLLFIFYTNMQLALSGYNSIVSNRPINSLMNFFLFLQPIIYDLLKDEIGREAFKYYYSILKILGFRGLESLFFIQLR